MRGTVPTETTAILRLVKGAGPRVHVAFEEGPQAQWTEAPSCVSGVRLFRPPARPHDRPRGSVGADCQGERKATSEEENRP
jgi:hypothetical protein